MRHIILTALAAVFLFSTTAHAAELKVGVFNVQDVLLKSEPLKDAREKLEKEYDPKRKELEKKQQDLQKQAQNLRKANQAQLDKFSKQQKEYDEAATLYMQNIQVAEQEIRVKMDLLIVEAAKQVARENKLDLILDSAVAIYSLSSMNVNDVMLVKINALWKADKEAAQKAEADAAKKTN